MFGSVQIKQEYSMDDRNQLTVGANTTVEYVTFNNSSVEYPYHPLPHFWNQNQSQYPKDFSQKNDAAVQIPRTTANPTYLNQQHQHAIAYNADHQTNDNQIQVNISESGHDESRLTPGVINTTTLINPVSIVAIQQASSTSPTGSSKRTSPGRPSKRSSTHSTSPNVVKKVKCQCEICFKEFGHKSNLFIHMRTHNGERPYKCKQCDKCFTHSGNLAIHMRTHSGERPYACNVCGKMFSHSGNLSTHLRTHSGVKPYKCKICQKEFRHSGNLSIHERIHSGIKPFQCKVCGKEFYHSGNLTTHMKKHPVTIATEQCESRGVIPIIGAEYVCTSVNVDQVEDTKTVLIAETKDLDNSNDTLIENELNEESNTS